MVDSSMVLSSHDTQEVYRRMRASRDPQNRRLTGHPPSACFIVLAAVSVLVSGTCGAGASPERGCDQQSIVSPTTQRIGSDSCSSETGFSADSGTRASTMHSVGLRALPRAAYVAAQVGWLK